MGTVDSELYALMTDHLGTDTGPESICGIGSVIGRPFVATRVVTSLQTDTASTAESLEGPHSYLIARDRFGRVRCEIGYLEPDFGPVHKRVKLGTYVYDPVGQTHTSMYPESFHSAFVIPFTLMDPIFAKGSPIFSFCVLAAAEDAHCLRKFRDRMHPVLQELQLLVIEPPTLATLVHFDLFNVAGLPALVDCGLCGAVEPEDGEIPLARDGEPAQLPKREAPLEDREIVHSSCSLVPTASPAISIEGADTPQAIDLLGSVIVYQIPSVTYSFYGRWAR